MFQIPAMITMSIVATRIYRSLADFSPRFTELYDTVSSLSLLSAQCGRCRRSACVRHNLPPSGFTTSKTNSVPAPSVPPEPMDVVMLSTYEQSQTPQTSQYASCTSGQELPGDKSTRLGLGDDVE